MVALLDISAGPEIVTWPMLLAGLGIGALASQLGALTVSSVPDERSGEVGGQQNTVTNLGASIGTALAGAMLISALTSSFFTNVADNRDVPDRVVSQAEVQLTSGVPFLPTRTSRPRSTRRTFVPRSPTRSSTRTPMPASTGCAPPWPCSPCCRSSRLSPDVDSPRCNRSTHASPSRSSSLTEPHEVQVGRNRPRPRGGAGSGRLPRSRQLATSVCRSRPSRRPARDYRPAGKASTA